MKIPNQNYENNLLLIKVLLLSLNLLYFQNKAMHRVVTHLSGAPSCFNLRDLKGLQIIVESNQSLTIITWRLPYSVPLPTPFG